MGVKKVKRKVVKKTDDIVMQEFKEILDKAAELSGISKIDLLIKAGYSESTAKQLASRTDRSLPACHIAEFCKAAGNNLIAEWIAERLGMKLVPKNSKEGNSNNSSESQKELDDYKKLVAELYRDLKKS